jgi:cysteine-rich repeat protein
VRQQGEACDDGNATNGDGCDDGALGSCRPTGCGNATRTGTEACDDGNALDGDGCDSNCTVSACGNGIVVGNERCDDAGETSNDGCSSTCMIEPGFSCTGVPSACATVCGDGRTAGGESCDDGARDAGDGCAANCTTEAGWACNGIPSSCTTSCGDGVVAGLEACDDLAPGESGDGCSAACTLETGWTCSGTPSVCVATCGDGLVRGNEVCDDAPPAEAGDGCSMTCQVETGWACNGAPSVCLAVCGDGLVTGAEVCDDAPPTESGDGCSATCTVEPGWLCAGVPSVCVTTCGDGTRAGTEACDDMNTQALDGCSVTCTVETPEVEPNDDGVPAIGGPGIGGNDFDPGGLAVANATAQGGIDAAGGNTVRVASIGVPGDEDVFALTNTTSTAKSVRIDVWSGASGFGPGRACGSSVDLGLTVRNAAGQAQADSNDRNGAADRCPGITVALLPNRTVYVHIVENGDDATVARYGIEFRFAEIICGDGTLTPGAEECDDGNTNDADLCSNACRVPAIDELEPNDTRAQATSSGVQLTGDTRIRGAIGMTGDVDVFRFTTSATQVVRLESFVGTSRDCNATSTTLRLFDSGGVEVVNDASSGLGGCALLQVPLPAGTWFVQLERTGNNAPIERYFLELTFPPTVGAEAEASASSGGNDTVATAEVLLSSAVDAWISADHQLENDVDVFAITVPPQSGVRAEIIEGDRATESCESNDLDATLSLLDSTGALITTDDDGGRGYCSRIDGLRSPSSQAVFSLARNNTATPQTMYLRVTRSQSGLTTPAQFVYRLVLTIR